MVDPNDVDLEQLISGAESSSDVKNMSFKDVGRKVATEGSVYLDDKGRMLVKCPEYNSSSSCNVCALYPLPDPEGGGTKMVCSGPLMEVHNNEAVRRVSASPDSACSYNPDRLGGSNDSGGWF